VDGIARYAASPACRAGVARWRERLRLTSGPVILGVDRLDYTKGIPERLLAVRRLLEKFPRWRGRLQYVQLAVPTRGALPEYAELRRRIEDLVASMNQDFGLPDRPAVHLLEADLDFTEVVALYRLGDVAAITPLHDGMNLVAKEYVAARSDLGGALVLSRFAGAAREFRQAALVNPYDADSMAETLNRTLNLPPVEARRQMCALRERVRRHTIYDWAKELLASVLRLDLSNEEER